ncbi:hypothetical protein ZIOFF_072111 [Zingiber officinale]|uniref:Uncharacterized protein n=1 Tax=Zingiber officinale TaxID=94328 RepID=A0A8J5CCG4_ZINOF|nr:hypothetical protein ZIOFF_072111 [Zingiber officinale]
MSHLTRVWMAASVAVMQGHSEGGLKSMSVRCSLQSADNRVVSASAGAAATAAGLGVGRALRGAGAEDRQNQDKSALSETMVGGRLEASFVEDAIINRCSKSQGSEKDGESDGRGNGGECVT